MARSQGSHNKKEVKNQKDKKRKEKEQKKMERRMNAKDGIKSDSMFAYVDEYGSITSTPPDPANKRKVIAADIEVSVPRRDSGAPESKIRTGIVTFFNDSKGYGFIRDLDNQQSVFVHVNDLIEAIGEQNRVTFEVQNGNRGPKAVNVKREE